jgi:hypothetical protein
MSEVNDNVSKEIPVDHDTHDNSDESKIHNRLVFMHRDMTSGFNRLESAIRETKTLSSDNVDDDGRNPFGIPGFKILGTGTFEVPNSSFGPDILLNLGGNIEIPIFGNSYRIRVVSQLKYPCTYYLRCDQNPNVKPEYDIYEVYERLNNSHYITFLVGMLNGCSNYGRNSIQMFILHNDITNSDYISIVVNVDDIECFFDKLPAVECQRTTFTTITTPVEDQLVASGNMYKSYLEPFIGYDITMTSSQDGSRNINYFDIVNSWTLYQKVLLNYLQGAAIAFYSNIVNLCTQDYELYKFIHTDQKTLNVRFIVNIDGPLMRISIGTTPAYILYMDSSVTPPTEKIFEMDYLGDHKMFIRDTDSNVPNNKTLPEDKSRPILYSSLNQFLSTDSTQQITIMIGDLGEYSLNNVDGRMIKIYRIMLSNDKYFSDDSIAKLIYPGVDSIPGYIEYEEVLSNLSTVKSYWKIAPTNIFPVMADSISGELPAGDATCIGFINFNRSSLKNEFGATATFARIFRTCQTEVAAIFDFKEGTDTYVLMIYGSESILRFAILTAPMKLQNSDDVKSELKKNINDKYGRPNLVRKLFGKKK